MSAFFRRTRSPLALVCLSLLSGVPGASLRGQAPAATPEPFSESVEVEVVSVDVIVTDRNQRRVLDLGKDDFELLVDGRPVPIEYFAAPRTAPASALEAESLAALPTPRVDLAAAAEADAPAAPANLVVYIDQTALENRARQLTVQQLREFLLARPEGADRVMVAAFEQNLNVLLLPTTDRASLEQALDKLKERPSRAGLGSSERIQLEHDVRSYGRENARLTASARVALAEQIGQQIERWAEAELDREQRSLGALKRLVDALAATEGRKAVVLATAGIRTSPARALYAALDQLRGAITSSDLNRSPALEIQGQDLQRQFEEVVQAAQNARVAFYTVSPVVAPPAGNSAEFASAGAISDRPLPRDLSVVDAASSVARLSGATGGAALTIGPDLSRRLETVTADVDASYSIGFSTGEEAGDQDHRIDVRVRRPGLAVRHRESFKRRSAPDRAESALAAAVTFGQAENPLGITLKLGAGTSDGTKKGGRIVPLAVGIPLHLVTLVPAGDERHGHLSVRLAVEDARGRMLEGSAAAVPIIVPEDQMERAMVSSWYHRAEMRLAPGHQRIAVTVLDEISGVQSTVYEEIEIPAAK